jgi:hypothetical protein
MWSKYDGPNRSGVGERDIYRDWLRYHAAYLVKKMDGVSDEDLWRIQTPSGLCLLGVVKHMAFVYRWWFATVVVVARRMSFRGERMIQTQTGE